MQSISHMDDRSGIIMSPKMDYVHLDATGMEFEAETGLGEDRHRVQGSALADGDLLDPELAARGLGTISRDTTQYAIAGSISNPAREGGIFKRHWFEVITEAVPLRSSQGPGTWPQTMTATVLILLEVPLSVPALHYSRTCGA